MPRFVSRNINSTEMGLSLGVPGFRIASGLRRRRWGGRCVRRYRIRTLPADHPR